MTFQYDPNYANGYIQAINTLENSKQAYWSNMVQMWQHITGMVISLAIMIGFYLWLKNKEKKRAYRIREV